MNIATNTTIQYTLQDGKKITLTTGDCAEIINALARRRLLSINIESIPADYEDIWTQECCAIDGEDEAGDAEIVICVNATDFLTATPRKKKKKR